MFRSFGMIAAVGVAVCASSAYADSNNILVLQEGDGNRLSVDQSAASNSVVAGYSDWSAPLVSDLAAALQLGDDNQIDVTVTGGTGSMVLFRQDTNNAIGLGNRGFVTASEGAILVTLDQLGVGNEAALAVQGASTGTISQTGNGNTAGIAIDGAGSTVGIVQEGNGLLASLEAGSGQNVTITQIGNPSAGDVNPAFVDVYENLTGINIVQYFPTFTGLD